MKILLNALALAAAVFATSLYALPRGFVYLKNIDPSIIQDIRYHSSNNFVGRPIKGYQASQCILTDVAADALYRVQQILLLQNMSLKVFDCYRPQTAVNDFIKWSQDPRDQRMKSDYYPLVNKADFFRLNYVAAQSGHTRGSTVDLTIVRLQPNGKPPLELPMGTHWDFMDERSHYASAAIQGEARENRAYLQKLMVQAGFEPYPEEWWHFTLKHEPHSETYFDFPVI